MESTTGKHGTIPAEVGQRLRGELERRGWTVQEFIDRLGQDASVSGSTAIYKYVKGKGKSSPPVEFLIDAAQVLEVSFAWLAHDDGERTGWEEESRIQKEMLVFERVALGRGWTKALSDALEHELGDRVPPVAHAVVAHHWRRVHNMALMAKGVEPGDIPPRLARSVAAPLKEFGIDMTSLAKDDRADYVMGVIPAVAKAAEFFLRKQVQEQLEKSVQKREEN